MNSIYNLELWLLNCLRLEYILISESLFGVYMLLYSRNVREELNFVVLVGICKHYIR